MLRKIFCKKLPTLIIFLLFYVSFQGNIAGSLLTNEPSEVAIADLECILIVEGAVDQRLNLTLSDLVTMPKSTVYSVLYCMGSRVKSGNWAGVKLRYILETAGLQSHAASLTFIASDGYEVVLDLKDAFRENVIIAYELDGHPLSEILRLVIPGKNGDVGYLGLLKLLSVRFWFQLQLTMLICPHKCCNRVQYLNPKIPHN